MAKKNLPGERSKGLCSRVRLLTSIHWVLIAGAALILLVIIFSVTPAGSTLASIFFHHDKTPITPAQKVSALTPSPSASITPTPSPTPTPTPTPTPKSTQTPVPTPRPTAAPTPTPKPGPSGTLVYDSSQKTISLSSGRDISQPAHYTDANVDISWLVPPGGQQHEAGNYYEEWGWYATPSQQGGNGTINDSITVQDIYGNSYSITVPVNY